MGPARILVVDDEPSLLQTLWRGLVHRGYDVMTAATGREALEQAAAHEPDVTLLDLGLPDMDGLEVCRHLRAWTPHPIVVLTADGDDSRKVAALDGGADDYVTKPFSMSELLARVRVALRHREQLAVRQPGEPLAVGALLVDVEGHAAVVHGRTLDLGLKDFALLVALARQPGRVLTHAALLDEVWGPGHHDAQRLRGHMARVRKELGTAPGTPRVEAVPYVGYRLVGVDG